MKKGISGIIAVVLILLITVALAGSVYMYVTGMFSGKTANTISISSISCIDGNMTLVINNDGSKDITSGDLKILVDNSDTTSSFSGTFPINPQKNTILIDSTSSYADGDHVVLIVASNSIRQNVYCE